MKKSGKETSCTPELPILLWTFGSITAGSSEKEEWVSIRFHDSFMANTPSCDYPNGIFFLRRIITCWEPVWGVVNSSSSRKHPFSSIHALSCVMCLGFIYLVLSRAFVSDNIHFQPQAVLPVVMHWLGCWKIRKKREQFNTRTILRITMSWSSKKKNLDTYRYSNSSPPVWTPCQG